MAIILISSKKRQNKLVGIMTVFLALVLFSIPLVLLNPWLKREPQIPVEETYKPEIKVNIAIIDSQKVKDLVPFTFLQKNFSYTAEDKNGLKVAGRVSAGSQEEAKVNLEKIGLKLLTIEDTVLGRSQPFIPY